MPFLSLLTLIGTVVFGVRSYQKNKKIKGEKLNEQERKKEIRGYISSIILAIVSALPALLTFIMFIMDFHNKDKNLSSSNTNPIPTITQSKSPTVNQSESSTVNQSASLSSCPDNEQLKSHWKPGQKHPNYPNVIASKTLGVWIPKRGYKFIAKDNKCDLQVQPKK